MYDYCVVGAGFFGSTIAERIANDLGAKVIVFDKRPHIGGNCYSEVDLETGIEFHKYGTHVFHTDSQKVWDYITQFTQFNSYYHQVLTTYKNKVYQMPINLETINSFYNLNLKPFEAKEFLKAEIERENIGSNPNNMEEKAISLVGKPLYEAFIKGYTIKQWSKEPKELPAQTITRLPVRYDYREDYFLNARWQGIPYDGYTKVFERMLNSHNIHLELNCDYFECINDFNVRKKTIYTGPIDRYFNYVYGKLDWISIKLQKEIIDLEDYQGTSVMNYAESGIKYTRIHEPRHLHPERRYPDDKTAIFYEYPVSDHNDPFYPVKTDKNLELLKKYKDLAKKEKNVIIGGRLGEYAYYDMDETILASLRRYENEILPNR